MSATPRMTWMGMCSPSPMDTFMQNALCERQDSLTVVSEIEACVPSLRRYACKLLKTQQDADDLVNDCLVRALGRLPTQWRAPTVRPWLFTIMHNVFVNHVRRSRTLAERVGIDAVGECEVSVEPT